MESQQIYNPTGGIARIVLHPAGTPLPEFGSGVEVVLEERGASYTEKQIFEDGLYLVRHTLTFRTPHGEGPYTPESLKVALRDGVVADVVFSSGMELRLGWSREFGACYPLRLKGVEFGSGACRVDLPLKVWTWVSVDRTALTE